VGNSRILSALKKYRAVYEGKKYYIAKDGSLRYCIYDKIDNSLVNDIRLESYYDRDENQLWVLKGIDMRYCGCIGIGRVSVSDIVSFIEEDGYEIVRYGDYLSEYSAIKIMYPDSSGSSQYISLGVLAGENNEKYVVKRFVNGKTKGVDVIHFGGEPYRVSIIRNNGDYYVRGRMDGSPGSAENFKVLGLLGGRYEWVMGRQDMFNGEIEEDPIYNTDYERYNRIM
jgi:hypothetical protein